MYFYLSAFEFTYAHKVLLVPEFSRKPRLGRGSAPASPNVKRKKMNLNFLQPMLQHHLLQAESCEMMNIQKAPPQPSMSKAVTPKEENRRSRKVSCALCHSTIETIKKNGDNKMSSTQKHALIHLEKFWACHLCDLKFNRKYKAAQHLRNGHEIFGGCPTMTIPLAVYQTLVKEKAAECFPEIYEKWVL